MDNFMRIRGVFFFVYLMLCLVFVVQAQHPRQWWYDIHQIDPNGVPWKSYMILSPGYMGINALPVPTQLKGEVLAKPEIEWAADLHFLDGERAQDAFMRIFYPFENGRVAVEIWGVGVEHYKHNQEIRDERMSRVENGEGWGVGDFYFSTNIKLLSERRFLPSVVLRMACKTASGELTGSRFTDTPGYWFDFSAGKTWGTERFSLRAYGMYGFYCWQTMSNILLQNDASLYGAGFEVAVPGLRLENSIQGYSGYKDERDRPVNYRLIAAKRIRKSELKLEYQHGIRDVLYRSLRLGWVQRF